MSSRYSVTEPHPTATTYVHCGRGGAGNHFKAPKTSNGATAHGPASLFSGEIPQSTSKFATGRGGAGNMHNASERAIFSFDEELARQVTRENMMKNGAVWHVGRGGAGNWTSSRPAGERKDSSSSRESNDEGFFGRLSHTFERR